MENYFVDSQLKHYFIEFKGCITMEMDINDLKSYKSKIDRNKLEIAANNMSAEEKKEQIISNIFGLMGSRSQVTKEEIREELKKFYG